jgi:hypothetical protein
MAKARQLWNTSVAKPVSPSRRLLLRQREDRLALITFCRPLCARENDPRKLRGLGFSLKAAAVQLPAPFDKRVAAARFDDGFDLEARHVVLADDRHLGKLILQEIQPTLVFVDLFDARRP